MNDSFKPKFERIEMPEKNRELLLELLAQNRLILEANCRTLRLLNSPMVTYHGDEED